MVQRVGPPPQRVAPRSSDCDRGHSAFAEAWPQQKQNGLCRSRWTLEQHVVVEGPHAAPFRQRAAAERVERPEISIDGTNHAGHFHDRLDLCPKERRLSVCNRTEGGWTVCKRAIRRMCVTMFPVMHFS